MGFSNSSSTIYYLFSILFLLPIFAVAKKSYVVYLGGHSHGPEFSWDDLDNRVKATHYEFLGSFLGSHENAKDAIFYSYTRHINGFAATLDDEVVDKIAKHPKVISIFPNNGRKLHTTHSWSFMGLEHGNGVTPANSLWKKARYGEDTIIGNLDTGIWPESKSFNDRGLGPIPAKWKGICQNNKDSSFHCNRKLIGARYFNKGYQAVVGRLNASYYSPRDIDGHGTHTLSTAAGSFVKNASVFGLGKGTAKGGSPKARVAAYRVCYPPINGNECFDADMLAAFDIAISDGVDVLSVSLGGDASPYAMDAIAIGSFHAVRNGIVVVLSAGNSGPGDGTVSNVAPWQFTVGASTMDRDFPSNVILSNKMEYQGQSLSSEALPKNKFFPIINSADAKLANASLVNAQLCEAGALDPKKAKGKILVCLRGDNARVDKGEQAAHAGAIGMILANNELTGNEVIADPHFLPATHLNYSDGVALYSYIKSTKLPRATITRPVTRVGTKPAPFMAAFSSKGPNKITPELLKPDITAPGLSVIAAYTEAQGPTDEEFDKRRVEFNSLSGTSMSCPHVSGVVGLLKTIYPHWSPAAIRSAIMTTASTIDNNKETILNASYSKATPFSYGAGHINPNAAADPGLVYDIENNEYNDFLCALGYNETQILLFTGMPYKCSHKASVLNLNYPSITVPNLRSSITVTRRVKNVGPPGTYKAYIREPTGISVSVKPQKLKFKKVGEEKTFKVTMKVESKASKKVYVFGDLTWSDSKHNVRSPIVVKAV
ncbi:hypothetical protein ACFE04_000223 [Oxalis oulophora]